MNKQEAEMWSNNPDVRRIPAREEMIEVVVRMTPAEYERICNSASWEGGGSAGEYMKSLALGNRRRGGC